MHKFCTVLAMENIIVAVGSKRGPKLNAVSEAIEGFAAMLQPGARFEVAGTEVETGVGLTPSSREESMRGARNRAQVLLALARTDGANWKYFVGLEGGLDVVVAEGVRRVFLESWAFVCDGTRGYFGRSGGVEMPEALAREVLENGIELSVAIDKFAGAVGIRDAQGAWGVLSGNLISRQEAFRVAVVAAFAPFYNARMYQAAGAVI
jgi:inosine/xanthosine triphosphatase